MAELSFIRDIGWMIIAAAVLMLVARLVRMPSIVAYILTGLVLGPMTGLLLISGFGHGESHDTLSIITELGIALLLFLVGLELSQDKIRHVGKVAVLAGIGQVVFTAAGGFVIAWVLGFGVMESVFIAVALTFSSTVVVVKLLDHKKELHSLYGRIAVGIFLVQDLVVVIMLTLLAGLAGVGGEGADAAKPGVGEVAVQLVLAFVGMTVLLVVALLASKYVLLRPFNWAATTPQAVFIWALTWCFLFVVGAQWMGLSLEIGAFLAGISLAQLPVAHDLRRRVHPLMNFFIAIFFVSLGAQMDLSAAVADWWEAAVLSLFVLIGNPFIFMWIIGRCGYGERTSFLTSVTVAQISEFSFIFAAMGIGAGLITQRELSIIMVVGLVTIAASSYMILYNHGLYALCRSLGLLKMFMAHQGDDADNHEPPLRNHVVIVGMNPLGQRLARDLHRHKHTVLAIDTDQRKLAGLPCRTMVGHIDQLAVVEEAGLPDAKLAITALQIEDTNNLFVYRCKRFGVPVAAHAFDRSVAGELTRLGADYLIDGKTASRQAMDARLNQMIDAATAAAGLKAQEDREQP